MSNLLTLGIDMNAMVNKVQSYKAQNLVDDLENLKNQNVYIFSGTADLVTSTGRKFWNISFFLNLSKNSVIFL